MTKLYAGTSGTIVPIAHIQKVDDGAVRDLLSDYDNIELDFISSEHDQGAVVELVFTNQNDREESQTGAMKPIEPSDVEHD